ncbi:MAG: hypothetical protein ONB51_09745, partial [candidate division KSB1 bacterium]|nr:hypothetical protein [candidate division KSB1 bacterium]
SIQDEINEEARYTCHPAGVSFRRTAPGYIPLTPGGVHQMQRTVMWPGTLESDDLENAAQKSCLQQAGSLRYGIFVVIFPSTGSDAYSDIIPSTQEDFYRMTVGGGGANLTLYY